MVIVFVESRLTARAAVDVGIEVVNELQCLFVDIGDKQNWHLFVGR